MKGNFPPEEQKHPLLGASLGIAPLHYCYLEMSCPNNPNSTFEILQEFDLQLLFYLD